MRSQRPLILALAVFLAGCHYYAPAEIQTLAPQERIQVELEDDEVTRLLAYVDPRSRTVKGQFVDQAGDSMTMVVRTPLAYSQVTIPNSGIVGLQRREVDNKKSFIFSAAAVGAVAVLAYLGFEGSSSPMGSEGDGAESALIPFLSFAVGLPFGIGR